MSSETERKRVGERERKRGGGFKNKQNDARILWK